MRPEDRHRFLLGCAPVTPGWRHWDIHAKPENPSHRPSGSRGVPWGTIRMKSHPGSTTCEIAFVAAVPRELEPNRGSGYRPRRNSIRMRFLARTPRRDVQCGEIPIVML